MIIPAEITAAISVLKFWPQVDVIPLAAWITIILVVLVFLNIFEVKMYGEIEFYMVREIERTEPTKHIANYLIL